MSWQSVAYLKNNNVLDHYNGRAEVGLKGEGFKFSLSYCSCKGGGSGGPPQENCQNKECRSHLRSFCNAFKVSNLPDCSLFAESSHLFYVFKCL